MSSSLREKARALRNNMTEAEKCLWFRIRCKQLSGYKFRRQQPIGPFIVDFVCLSKRLIIELDGGQHARQTEDDEHRTQWLEQQGFRVMRFWNNDIRDNIDGVLMNILSVLDLAEPPP